MRDFLSSTPAVKKLFLTGLKNQDFSLNSRFIMKLILLTVTVLLLVVGEGTADRILSRRTKRELASPLHVGGIRDPFGSYCQRRGGCCPGRDDLCTVPYLDTICYCDLFCNRTVSDCCPDFWGHCLGVQPPFIGSCERNGNTFLTGQTYKENCNLWYVHPAFSMHSFCLLNQEFSL